MGMYPLVLFHFHEEREGTIVYSERVFHFCGSGILDYFLLSLL